MRHGPDGKRFSFHGVDGLISTSVGEAVGGAVLGFGFRNARIYTNVIAINSTTNAVVSTDILSYTSPAPFLALLDYEAPSHPHRMDVAAE